MSAYVDITTIVSNYRHIELIGETLKTKKKAVVGAKTNSECQLTLQKLLYPLLNLCDSRSTKVFYKG